MKTFHPKYNSYFMTSIRTGANQHLPAFALHILLAALITWPAITCFDDSMFGGIRGDKYQFIWNFWWFNHAIIEQPQNPLYTFLQYHPTGTSLTLHDMGYFWSLLSIPLQPFMGLNTILNIFMLSCFVLNGMAFYYFAYKVNSSKPGALLGSILFAYCPYFIGRFTVSHITYLSAFFIPLFFLSVWRYNEKRTFFRIVPPCIYVFLTTLCSFYYGVVLFVVLSVYFLYQIIIKNRSHLYLIKHFIVASIITFTLLSPILLPVGFQIQRGDYQSSESHDGYKYLETGSADLLGYFVPDFSIAKWWGYNYFQGENDISKKLTEEIHGNFAERTVYPGWTSWMILVSSIFISDIRKRFWPWIVLAILVFIWTLGPTLYVSGRPYFEGWLPLRFIKDVPVFSFLRTPSRFSFFIPFVSGLLISYIISRISKKNMAASIIVSLIIFALIIFEFYPINQKTYPSQLFASSFYTQLRNDDSNSAILNVPVDFHGARGGGEIYLYAQTIHEKPIVGGYISHTPYYVYDTLNIHPLLSAIEHREYNRDKSLRLDLGDFSETKRVLTDLNIGYVILHKHFLSRRDLHRLLNILGGELGRSIYEDDLIVAFAAATQ